MKAIPRTYLRSALSALSFLLLAFTLSFTRLSADAGPTSGNLLPNGGFEEGPHNDAPPWGVGGWRGSLRAVSTGARSGQRALMIEGGSAAEAPNSSFQIVNVDPTGLTQYRLNAWVRFPHEYELGPSDWGAPYMAWVRWVFPDGSGARTIIFPSSTEWTEIAPGGGAVVVPPPGVSQMGFRIFAFTFNGAAFIDDCEVIAEPSGKESYPGVKGTVKDSAGNPVQGAVVFLKSSVGAQEFAGSSGVTDSEGNYAVATKEEGPSFVVAWKQGYALSAEKQVELATGSLVSQDLVLPSGRGGRNLALSTAQRRTLVVAQEAGSLQNPKFRPEYVFDGNAATTRYFNKAKEEPVNDRWIYVDLDPDGRKSFTINEFVITWLGITTISEGWPPSLNDTAAKDFAIEYTTSDPATETAWESKVAFSVVDAPVTFAPVVIRLANPITARAIRLHVTKPAGIYFGPVECEVNSDTLPRGSIQGVVKNIATGAPLAGARVFLFRPVMIQNDPDSTGGLGGPIPFVVDQEPRIGTPYEYPLSKNIQQSVCTDANGRYTLDVNSGVPVKVAVSLEGYGYRQVDITPAEDGSPTSLDLSLGKQVLLSGVVRDANGPVYNAIVQVGGSLSKDVEITDASGAYRVWVEEGSREVYADAYGHAGKVATVTISGATTKDIVLDAQSEPTSMGVDFETSDDWEIAHFDQGWQLLTSLNAASSSDQNATPNGRKSALVTDSTAKDDEGVERNIPVYQMLQRKAAKRVPVEAGKSYNVYFQMKAENWLTPGNQDACHYEVFWLNQNGDVIDRILSHPLWITPQAFWQTYSLGHPNGSDHSVALVRLTPPVGAAWLDLKIGWLRNPSGATEQNPKGTNPEGTLLFIDDLVVDGFASAPTITIAPRPNNGGITLTWTGALESSASLSGPWAPVPGANNSPLNVSVSEQRQFYRSRLP